MMKRAFAFILIVFNMTSSTELCKRYSVKFNVYVEKAACGEEKVLDHEMHSSQCVEYCDLNPKVSDSKPMRLCIQYELLLSLFFNGRSRISQTECGGGGAHLRLPTYYSLYFFPENCIQLDKIDREV